MSLRALFLGTTLGVFALLPIPATAQRQPSEGVLLIQGARLVRPESGTIIEDGWVLIRGDRIAEVGEGDGPHPPEAEVVDASHRWLIPGLIDSHVHLIGVLGMTDAQMAAHPELVAAYRKQLPRSYLYHGFTTLVDLNTLSRDVLESVKSSPLAPDIFDCDGALSIANGYPMNFLPAGIRFDLVPNFLWDARQAENIPQRFQAEDHTPSATVGRVKAAGGVCVKTHYEPGFGPFRGTLPTPSEELIAEVLAESHARDLPVLMHANSYEAHSFAERTNVDAVVHGLWNWDDFESLEEIPEPMKALLDRVVEKGIGYMATSRVLGGLGDLFDSGFLDRPGVGATVPAELLAWFGSEEGQWFRRENERDFGGLSGDAIRRRLDFVVQRAGRVVKYLADQDANLLFGSDTPSSPTFANPPGYNGFLEIQLLEQAGVPLTKILRMATIDNARALHLEDLYGSIEPGKVASLVLLEKNPLETAEAYDSIDRIILRGRVVLRKELSAQP